ncbi:MAG: hypothetical protein ACHQHN_08475 [Sphingobacteriales bacterium]
MEDIEILSDSTLNSSIDEGHIYQIRNDTLLIKYAYNLLDTGNSNERKIEYHPYVIISANNDTIILKHHYKAMIGLMEEHDEIFVFVSIEKYKQPVNNFKYLELLYGNPFGGSVKVTVDSIGEITYLKYPEIKDENGRSLNLKRGHLSKSEFENFKVILSESMITRLPESRGCGIDEAQREFIIEMDNKVFKTKGCAIYYPQRVLLNYLYKINENKEVN